MIFLSSYVTWGKLIFVSLSFLICKMGIIIIIHLPQGKVLELNILSTERGT